MELNPGVMEKCIWMQLVPRVIENYSWIAPFRFCRVWIWILNFQDQFGLENKFTQNILDSSSLFKWRHRKSNKSDRWIKCNIKATSGTGYKQITINRKQYLIHRIVAELFVDNDDPANKTQVNHINENKIDNRAEISSG